MKTIGPTVFILIAGILSSTNAQSSLAEFRSECNRNGGPNAFETFTIGITNMRNSVESVMEEVLRAYNGSANGMAAALTVYCDNVEDLDNAMINFGEKMKPCLQLADREMPGMSTNYITSVIQFPCANRNLMEAVHNSTDRHCFISKLRTWEDCAMEMASGLNATRTNSARHEAMCSLTQTFEQCTVRVFGECEDKIFSTTLDFLYKSTNNYLSCENLTTSPKQEASQPGVANFL